MVVGRGILSICFRTMMVFFKFCSVLQAALKDAKQNNMVDKEIASIRSEIEVSMSSCGPLMPHRYFSVLVGS